jgi:hypothetical protein
MKTEFIKGLPELTAGSRKQIWRVAEQERLRLRQAQRKCTIDDEFRGDSGGRRLDTDLASTVSVEYARAYFQAIAGEYIRLGRPYRRLDQLLTIAMNLVYRECKARWKALDFDDGMSLESACLPIVKTALRDQKDQLLIESLQAQKSAERVRPRNFLENLSPDDPDYKIAKRFQHEAWGDSYGLEAEAVAGRASFKDFVDGCVHLFEKAAEAFVAIKDDSTIDARCKKLDVLARQFIRKTKAQIANQSERLGEAKVTAASDDFSRRVLEVSARSKQQIHKRALGESISPVRASRENSKTFDIKSFERWIQPLRVRLKRELISPEQALEELRSIANNAQCPVRLSGHISEELDHLYQASSGLGNSSSDALRAALGQPSENIRREAVDIILNRITAPHAIKDYHAAKRHSERMEAIYGRPADLPMAPQPPTDPKSEHKAPASGHLALGAARRAVVMPILNAKGWSRGKWGTKAGVGKNSVYEYLAGKRRLSSPNRKAMAEVLRLKPEELPQ